MYKFSEFSKNRLAQCDPKLQMLFEKVIEQVDCMVLCGHRGKEAQNNAYDEGRSTLRFPESKHNKKPSKAVDVAPYPLDWNDLSRFYFFAGHVKAIAHQMGIKIRWGGDWDSDNSFKDQNFHDLPHFELRS
jgi:hypothetical protein